MCSRYVEQIEVYRLQKTINNTRPGSTNMLQLIPVLMVRQLVKKKSTIYASWRDLYI